MNKTSNFFGIFCIVFFAICIVFFVGEQRIDSRNYEFYIQKVKRHIRELEEQKQQLLLEYNNEYLNFVQSSIKTDSKPISINDIKIIEVKTKSSPQQKIKREETISDFERIIKLIKNKIG